MAGGGGGGGDKRSANAEVNLVPYIDLLSTLICFLLITAVWQQVSVITTNSSTTPPSEDSFNPNPTPPDPNKVELSVKIFDKYLEASAGKEVKSFNHVNGQIDKSSFKPLLEEWKKKYPDKLDITINSESQIPYKLLIETMDAMIEENYTGLAINTN
jgi:biopolymer transport protein ExbD